MSNGTIQDGTLSNTAILGTGGSNSITAAITGTASVTNSGGTNTLTQSNSYAGTTIISGGTLVASNQYALGTNSNTTTVSGGGVLDLGGFTQTQTSVTQSNGIVTNGTLSNTIISGAGGVNTNYAIIAGTSLVTNSAGTNTLTESNTYTGNTFITGGTLKLLTNNGLGANTNTTTISGNGVLDLGNVTQTQTKITLQGTGGTVTNGTLTNTAINGTSGTSIIYATITGTASVTNSGGTNTLTQSNSYAGTTIISGGTLVASNQYALGTNTNTTTVSGGGVLDLGGFTQTQTSVTQSNGIVTNGTLSNTIITGIGGINTNYAIIAGSSLVTNSSGTNTLTQSNSYTGNTFITGGALKLLTNNGLGANTNTTTISGNGVLDLGNVTQTQTKITLNGTGGIVTNGILTNTAINGTSGSNTIYATITGAASVTNSGGTNTLTASNSYAGTTLISGGTLVASNQYALGTNTNTTTVVGGGVLNLGGFTQTQTSVIQSNGIVTNGTLSNTIIAGIGGVNTNYAIIAGSSVVTNSSGTNTLIQSNTYTGGTFITAGKLNLLTNNGLGVTNGVTIISGNGVLDLGNLAQAQASVTLSNGVVTNGTLTNTILSGTGGINTNYAILAGSSSVTNSSGTNTLVQSNTYTGGTFITGGKINLLTNNGLGAINGATTISGNGVLDLGNLAQAQALVTMSNGVTTNGIFTNTAILATGGTNSVATILAGTSSVTNASAVTILSLSNSYTGGTTISGGTLFVTNSGTLGAITGNTTITNDGTLNLGGTTQVQNLVTMGGCTMTNGTISNTEVLFTAGTNTVCANIAGTSSVISTGGTNTLSGTNNTYTGGTYITNSEIIVSSSSSLGAATNILSMSNGTLDLSGGSQSQGNVTVNNSTLADGRLTNAGITFTGGTNTVSLVLAGSSGLTNSAGVTTLFGNNTYSGTTRLNGGTVVAASTNAVGTSGVILNGGDLTVSNNNVSVNSLTWATNTSIITYTTPGTSVLNVGTLSITDAGQTNLIAVTTLDNNTNLFLTATNGSFDFDFLNIQGQSNGAVTFTSIMNNGTNFNYYQIATNGSYVVSGTDSITNNFTTANLSYAANSTLIIAANGSLNVTTNYTSANSGTLEYYAVSPSDAPRITVGGIATLGGRLVMRFVNGMPAFGDKFTLFSAGTINGRFSLVDMSNGLLRGRQFCEGDPTFGIIVAPASYAQVAMNQNQTNVANALNSFIPATGGDELTVSTALDSLTAVQYQNAFNEIMPAVYSNFSTYAFNQANALNNSLIQRLGNLRVAGVGFTQGGFSNSPILDDNKNPKSREKDILIPSQDNHWGVFVDGNGIFANINNNNQLPGSTIQSGGATLGANYKWNETFTTGVYTGYQGTQLKQSGGTFVCDNGSRFGAFGTYGRGGFFVNGILGGDTHSYQVNRNILFPGINRTATSSPTAGELDSMLATGYDIKKGNFTFGPITSLQYTYFGLQPFTETGAQSLDLSTTTANANSMIYSLGAHCFYTWQVNKNIMILPQVSLAWQHEFLQNPYALSSTLPNGANFAMLTTAPARDSFFPSAGFTVSVAKKYDITFTDSASTCNPSLISQNLSLSLGMQF